MSVARVSNSTPLVDDDGSGGHVAIVRPQEVTASPADVATPAANSPATVVYGALQQTVHTLTGIAWSYSAAPTAGGLQIFDGPNLVFTIDITAAGANSVRFKPPRSSAPGNPLTIRLAAGGSGILGKLSVLGYRPVQLPIQSTAASLDMSQPTDSQYLPFL